MPTYEYICRSCGHTFDIVQAMRDESMTVCPECGGELRKVFAPPSIAFKGSGFYATDHGKKSKEASEKSDDRSGEKAGEKSGEKCGERSGDAAAAKSDVGSDKPAESTGSKDAPKLAPEKTPKKNSEAKS